ncbi:hypothetical protein GCM10010510_68950 [Streptomyces anandii JCM 4720]|nr:hypothetical protein GCM10010510_68950 [Streptomyces anandii JCM 4720]
MHVFNYTCTASDVKGEGPVRNRPAEDLVRRGLRPGARAVTGRSTTVAGPVGSVHGAGAWSWPALFDLASRIPMADGLTAGSRSVSTSEPHLTLSRRLCPQQG